VRRSFPGTGLTLAPYLAVVVASVAVFLLWGGPLWAAPPGTSHVTRFTVSYLIVIPFALVALRLSHAWSWSHLVGTMGSVWAIKLLVTAVTYELAIHDAPHVPPEVRASTVESAAPAPTCLQLEEPAGRVMEIALPLAQPATSDARAALTIEPRDTFRFVNGSSRLHTARLIDASGAAVLNVPVPPGAPATAPVPEEGGTYLLRCGAHPDETTAIEIRVPGPRPCVGVLVPSAPALQTAVPQ
jgi:plastocyanin